MSDPFACPPARALWYEAPASGFNASLPIGNGRLGLMVAGARGSETLPVNDDRFWAGRAVPAPDPEGPIHLAAVRAALAAGDMAAAERLVETRLLTGFNQPYLPAADLVVDWHGPAKGPYRRALDLGTGIASVELSDAGGRRQRREAFVSAPDQVAVLAADGDGTVSAALASKLRHRTQRTGNDIVLWSDAPSSVVWPGIDPRCADGEGIVYDDVPPRRCVTVLRVLAPAVDPLGDAGLRAGGETVTLLLATATSEAAPDPLALCRDRLDAAERLGVAALRARHVADHAALFGRVRLRLGDAAGGRHPTDRRIARHAAGTPDADLEALLFDYGRYLLIASSRPGTQAANLQGIWNDRVQPPWWSNYTLNINTEMNYWPAEVCNLAECHEPLFDLIDELALSGAETARIHYGMAGWVAHHQSDYLRQTTPVGRLPGVELERPARYGMWPMAGAWLCQHLWQHYAFSGDAAFLRARAWPAMRGAALFLLDWLVEMPGGALGTAPSTSPENSFLLPDGTRGSVSRSSAMDLALLRAHFTACIETAQRLAIADDAILPRIEAALCRLPGPRIGTHKRLMEWETDWPEGEPPHRHVSHLFDVFPGDAIDATRDPELAEAARRSLDERGPVGTGWSFAWKIALWARLRDGARAHRELLQLFNPVDPASTEPGIAGGGIYPNALTACPPFQIDANFGYTAGVAEMLVQSTAGDITLLPALPPAWPDGAVAGLRCRGQVTLDLAWRAGEPVALRLASPIAQTRHLRWASEIRRLDLAAGVPLVLDLEDPRAIGSR